MRKDVPLAQINGNILEGIRPVPMERIQDRAATQIVDSLVRQTTEEIAVGVQPVPAERMQERAGEQIVTPVSQIKEDISAGGRGAVCRTASASDRGRNYGSDSACAL